MFRGHRSTISVTARSRDHQRQLPADRCASSCDAADMTGPAARLLSILVAVAIAGCGTAADRHHAGSRPHSRSAVALAARQPLPAATVRRLPPGVFYLISGDPSGLSYAVWQVSAARGEHLIQPIGPGPGNGVRAFSAARAGIVASVAGAGMACLARLTRHGRYWVPHGRPAVHGFDPTVTSSGELLYDTPPGSHSQWAIWARRSFTAAPARIYQQRAPIGGIAAGPRGQIATWRSSYSSSPPRHPPPGLIISATGHVRRAATGYPDIGNLGRGPRAPAIAVQSTTLAVELLFASGRRLALPKGWYPYTWSPSGRTLLVLGAGPALGTWAPRAPGRGHVNGPTSPHVGIGQVKWLSKPPHLEAR